MSIVSRPQPSRDEVLLARREDLALGLARLEGSRKIQKPSVLMRTLSRTESSSTSLFTARAWSKPTSQATSSQRPSSAR